VPIHQQACECRLPIHRKIIPFASEYGNFTVYFPFMQDLGLPQSIDLSNFKFRTTNGQPHPNPIIEIQHKPEKNEKS
jgi:hypothetical protein